MAESSAKRRQETGDEVPGFVFPARAEFRLPDATHHSLIVQRRPIAHGDSRRMPSSLGRATLALAIAEEQRGSALRESQAPQRPREWPMATPALRRVSQLQRPVHHDALSGLPNLLLLLLRLQESIAEAFEQQQRLARMFIDLENCAVANDHRGQDLGGILLTVIATRVTSCERDGTACRCAAADDCMPMLSDDSDAAIAVGIAQEIRGRIDGHYWIDDREVQINASIGLARNLDEGGHIAPLTSTIDTSMHGGTYRD